MTESDVLPFLTREWRTTLDIARDVWDAEGQRGDFSMVRTRVLHALSMLEKRGRVERNRAVLPHKWRLSP